MRRMVLVSGSSNQELSSKIANHLNIQLVDPQLRRFANGEIFCEIEQSVRGADVFVTQTMSHPVNDHLMELLIMVDALKRASAASITAVIPHYGYSRQDRKANPRTPISAKLVADLLTVAGVDRVITMDLHAGQIQGFFNIPFDNIFASPVILDYIRESIDTESLVLVSPDAGGVERSRWYAKRLNTDIAMIDKRRMGPNVAKAMNIVGEVEGKDVIIVDDIIDTAGTLIEAAKTLKRYGANKIYSFATHGVFSPPAVKRIVESEDIEQVIVTDTLPLPDECKESNKIKRLTTSKILAQAIERTFNHDSVSSLFS